VRFAGIVLAGMLACEAACLTGQAPELRLPAPQRDGKVSLERCLATRRSVRAYRDDALKLAELSQLLWAAQGITGGERLRTAPSAGALYPLEVYVLAGSVEGLAAGIYKYRPERHELVRVAQEDRRRALAEAALGQQFIAQAPAVFVIAGVYERTARRYGDRAPRYVHIEVGHAGQNICLQAVALGLGSVTVGAFRDPEVKRVVGLADDESPLYIIPVGRPR
jgi:SagB-type dehydrogenase family enzyme